METWSGLKPISLGVRFPLSAPNRRLAQEKNIVPLCYALCMRYNPPRPNRSLPFVCLNCGKEGRYFPDTSRGKFCSAQCHADHRFMTEVVPRVANGRGSRRAIKRWLVVERGYECEICGIADWQRKELALELDHIDGNSDNNKPENVRFLCPNCHSQTPTSGSRNFKNTKRNKYQRHWKAKHHGPLA